MLLHNQYQITRIIVQMMGVGTTGGQAVSRLLNEFKWWNSRGCAASSDPAGSVQDNKASSKHF